MMLLPLLLAAALAAAAAAEEGGSTRDTVSINLRMLLHEASAASAGKGKLSGSVTPAIRSQFGETCSSASKLPLARRAMCRVGAAR
jgi:hypothetical protein